MRTRSTARFAVAAGLLGLVFVLALVVALSFVTSASATSAQDRLDITNQKIARMRALIDTAKKKEGRLNGQVEAYDSRLNTIGGELATLQTKLAVVEEKLARTQIELARLRDRLRAKTHELHRAEARLAWQRRVFVRRVVDSYKTGDVDYLDVLLGSSDWEDLISRYRLVAQLVGNDNLLVAQLDAARREVAREKASLAQLTSAKARAEAELRDQRAELAALKAEVVAKQQAVLAARSAKAHRLAQVARTRRGYEEQERELLSESHQLQAIISGSSGSGTVHGTGRLAWPVSGPVTSGFGWRTHPIFHVRKFHTGIDIGAGYGAAIHAADSGTVIYAAAMTGYGNVIVVDHGGGLSTLYAHQSGFAVGTGSGVSRGQVIGYVGMTGYTTGPHLHFEVRVNGSPVDPLAYLP
jgi:murein DD-endopeptidase MepM/ murein hydrolase activator NlpD